MSSKNEFAFKDTKIGHLPEEWEVARLGDVAKIRGGKNTNNFKKVAFIPMELISDSQIVVKYQIRERDSVKSSTYCEAADLLLAKITPSLENGKQGIVPSDVPNGFALATTEVFPISCEGLDKFFLFYILKFQKFRNKIISSMTGTTGRQRASKNSVENLKIPLPPLPEQRRIAEILTTADTAIQKVSDAIAKTERLKSGLMQELLTKGAILGFMFDTTVFGDVLDNRTDIEKFSKNHQYHVTHIQHDEISKTPNETIRRRLLDIFQKMSKKEILTEGFVLGRSRLGRAKLGTGSLLEAAIKRNPKHIGDALIGDAAIKNGLILVTDDTRLLNEVREHGGWAITLGDFLDDRYREFKDSEVGRIPRGWEVTTLRAECVVGTGGTPSRKHLEYFGGMVPWVKTTEVNYNIIVETGECITKLGLQNSNAKIYPAGTLIIAMYGQGVTRGKCAILGVNAAINQACAAIMPKNDNTIHVKYLQYWCQFKYDQIRNLGQGANQSNLNLSVVGSMRFPLPPLPEQHRIAEILSTVDKRLELERKRKEKLERIKKGLMNDLLTGKRRVKL